METFTQRHSEPSTVIRLWKTINELMDRGIHVSRQQLITHMTLRFRCFPQETSDQIVKAVYDGLLIFKAEKGKFYIPKKIPEPFNTSKDMFCHTCHKPGEVIGCQSCWRVMHPKKQCWDGGDNNWKTCKQCQLSKDESEKVIRNRIPTRTEMSEMLMEVMKEVQAKCPELEEVFKICSNEDIAMWQKVLFKFETSSVTLLTIQKKIQNQLYKRFLEFDEDFRTLIHNIILVFGHRSLLGSRVVVAHKIVMSQENSIRECIDCYLNWSKRSDSLDWFSMPCHPPHAVKIIRTVDGPNLPGKVILEDGEFTSVKLFGPNTKTQVIENSRISDKNTIPNPRNEDERIAYMQYKRYVENLEKSQLPVPNLKFVDTMKDSIQRNSIPWNREVTKFPKSLRLKTGQVVYAKTDTTGNAQGEFVEEEEQKFSGVKGKNPEDWVRRSARARKPVRRLCDEISGSQGMSREEMMKFKQEIVDNNERERIALGNSSKKQKVVPAPKIEKTKQGWNSHGRSGQIVSHLVTDSAEEENVTDTWIEAAKKVYRGTIDDLREQLTIKEQEIEILKQKFDGELIDAKKRQFCTKCLSRAFMYCCFDHSYCSTECQNEDWKDGHSKECRNPRMQSSKRK